MAQTVVFEGSSNQVVAALWSSLSQCGYHLVRSFDLQSALAHCVESCGCPYHGIALCTCQYVVLLAYPPDRTAAPPRVLTVHTYEDTTWVTLQFDRNIGAGETRVLMSALTEAGVRSEAEERAVESWTGYPVPVSSH